MIDLNNTWCEATVENYKALLPLYYAQNINLSLGKRSFYIKSDNYAYFSFNTDTPNIKYKQIHLVNGEFKYVEEKPKNNFKDYGFEADFEGEILKEIEDMSVGKLFIGYIVYDCKVHSCIWQYNGVVITRGVNQLTFNLKPIKKEWYENPDNFPSLVVDDNKKILYVNKYQYTKENNTHWVIYEKMGEEIYSLNLEYFRPATKEEVLALLVKE